MRRVIVAGAVLLVSCTGALQRADRPERLELALVRVLESWPDSVVPVLVRLSREPLPQDQEHLARLGFSASSVRGRVITGRVRAGAARRLTRLSVLEWVELAGDVRVTRNE